MPVALTFQSERLFNTALGGICSMICGVIILAYMTYKAIEMLPASYGTQNSMVD